MKKSIILLTVLMVTSGNVGLSEPIEEDNLRPLIEKFEGIRLKAYRCPRGIATIGFGSTRYEDGSRVRLGDRISLEEAEDLYQIQVNKVREAVDEVVIPELNDNQRDALVSFVYNVGITAFKNSTLLEKINEDPNNMYISEEFMKWTTTNGRRLKGLVKRRQAEIDLYFLK